MTVNHFLFEPSFQYISNMLLMVSLSLSKETSYRTRASFETTLSNYIPMDSLTNEISDKNIILATFFYILK